MQVTLETTGTLGRRMTIAVPAERMEKEYSTRLRRVSQTARFPGFRPGKAPMKMVEAQYGPQVMDEVAGELIRVTFYEAVSEKGLKPAGGPNIEPKSVGRGKDFEYIATFEVYPQVARLDIKGCRIEKPQVAVTEADIDRTIETLRHQRLTWRPVERAAQNGDRVIIDFQGSIAGTVFEGGTAKDFPLVLGNNTLIDGFESGLVGARAGESRTLDLKFPAEYRNATLAGKAAQFAVTVKQVQEPVLPEVNEEFAKAYGVADGKVETLRAEVRANLESEMRDRVRRELREQVFKTLIDVNAFDVPKALEDEEIKSLIRMTRSNFESQGLPAAQAPTDPALFVEQARSRVKLGLILSELIRAKDLKADAAAVRARIESLAASYDQPQAFIDWCYSKREQLAEIESQVLEDQAVDMLLETADASDKAMTFLELTQLAARRS
jgi:trigger factor